MSHSFSRSCVFSRRGRPLRCPSHKPSAPYRFQCSIHSGTVELYCDAPLANGRSFLWYVLPGSSEYLGCGGPHAVPYPAALGVAVLTAWRWCFCFLWQTLGAYHPMMVQFFNNVELFVREHIATQRLAQLKLAFTRLRPRKSLLSYIQWQCLL